MVLSFKSSTTNAPPAESEPPRILTEEEQILVAIDKGVHEVRPVYFFFVVLLSLSSSARFRPFPFCMHL